MPTKMDVKENGNVCLAHDALVKMLSRFETKLDTLNASSVDFNTKLAEFLARHDEQEKRFYEHEKKVHYLAKDIDNNKTGITILKENQKTNVKDIDNIGRKIKTVDEKCDKNKTVMYGGAVSGLLALVILLGNFIFKLATGGN